MTMWWLVALLVAGSPMQDRGPVVDPAAKPGVIRGHVLRAGGRPLPRAVVRLMPAGPGGRGLSTQTELDGRYEFADVPPGRYRVSARKGGYLALEYGQRRAFARGDTIELASGATRTDVDLVLPRPGAIEGHIVDENGDPVERVSVSALEVRFVNGQRRLVPASGANAPLTNDLGRFRIFGLQPGQYVVSAAVGQVLTANLPGYAPTYFPGTSAPAEAGPVTLAMSEERHGVDFALAPVRTARIAGTVIDSAGQPIGGGLILVPSRRSQGVGAPVGARIGGQGAFEFTNVAPGEYVIQAYRGRRNGFTDGEFAAQPITVNGVDLTGLTIRTSPGSSITGRVILEGTGSPRRRDIELVAVSLDPDRAPQGGGSPPRAEIRDGWTFELAGMSGDRVLRATRLPPGWALKSVVVDGTDVIDAPLPFGDPRQSLRDVEVTLTQAVTRLTGTALDGQGRTVGEYTAVLFPIDRDLWTSASRFLKMARPEADGTFAVTGLPPGSYYAVALDMVRGEEWQDPALLESLAAQATRVTLGTGENRAVTLRLTELPVGR